MRGLLWIALGGAWMNPLHAADREFKDVVRVLSEELHANPMHIPMMGLVNSVMKVAHPVGAKHLEIAVFQDVDWDEDRSPAESVKRALGDWRPFLQTRNDRGETVLVYMRENGRDVIVLMAALQRDEMIVTEVRMDPKQLKSFLDSPNASAWKLSGTHQDNDN